MLPPDRVLRCARQSAYPPIRLKSGSRLGVVFAATVATCRTRFELWLLGYDWTRRLINAPGMHRRMPRPAADTLDTAKTISRMVNAVGRRMSASCLVRSLAAQRMLAARGLPSEVCIGVDPETGTDNLNAHAWLESFGEVLNDDPTQVKRFRLLENASGSTH